MTVFCPLDGGKLTDSKWEWCGFQLLICPQGHVWEVQTQEWGRHKPGYFEFDLEKMVRCECGQICPETLMEAVSYEPLPEQQQLIPANPGPEPTERKRVYTPWPKPSKQKAIKVCPDCFEKIKQAWRPDLEQSFARLVITPIRYGDKVVFDYEEAIEIKPYPNPYGCGGCWGGGRLKTEAEVEELVKSFTEAQSRSPFVDDYYSRWQRLGVKFVVIRKPERTVAEQINEEKREYVEEHPEEAAGKNAQMQLLA